MQRQHTIFHFGADLFHFKLVAERELPTKAGGTDIRIQGLHVRWHIDCRLTLDNQGITINLNIKLDADVRLRVEEKAKSDVEKNPIF